VLGYGLKSFKVLSVHGLILSIPAWNGSDKKDEFVLFNAEA